MIKAKTLPINMVWQKCCSVLGQARCQLLTCFVSYSEATPHSCGCTTFSHSNLIPRGIQLPESIFTLVSQGSCRWMKAFSMIAWYLHHSERSSLESDKSSLQKWRFSSIRKLQNPVLLFSLTMIATIFFFSYLSHIPAAVIECFCSSGYWAFLRLQILFIKYHAIPPLFRCSVFS